MRVRAFLLALGVVVALSGCDLWYQFFGSSDAAITEFNIDGIIGTAAIDPAAHTVVVTVEPMDLTAAPVTPDITVSANATLTPAPSAVQDGVPVTYTVKAQNGASSAWTVTVNVAFGTSFTVDGTMKVVMMHGYVDSTQVNLPSLIGSGLPVGYQKYDTFVDSFDADQQVSPSVAGPHIYVYFYGTVPGTYAPPNVGFSYANLAGSTLLSGSDLAVNVSAYGALGAPIQGTFTCTATDGALGPHAVTNGFFKVRYSDDSSGWALNSGG
jgi:hypothetical protein